MRKLSITHLVILLCLSVFTYSTHSIASQKDGLFKIYFFDIGQGDSIFIETPNGNQVLIDGGPDNSVLQKLGEVMPFYDHDIDLVILTHSDADHVAGLIEVLKRYGVKNMIYSDIVRDTALYDAWRESVAFEEASIVDPVAGKVIDLGSGATITILHPSGSLVGQAMKKVNNNSVVAMLDYGETEVLLTGDIEKQAERSILLSGISVDADILKIAHHGSKTSSIPEFLTAVSPEVAIIQVGAKNRYGHPTPEVLKRLDDFGIKYYRNDTDGNIKVTSDGKNFKVEHEKTN